MAKRRKKKQKKEFWEPEEGKRLTNDPRDIAWAHAQARKWNRVALLENTPNRIRAIQKTNRHHRAKLLKQLPKKERKKVMQVLSRPPLN